jgi:hypothetical protein
VALRQSRGRLSRTAEHQRQSATDSTTNSASGGCPVSTGVFGSLALCGLAPLRANADWTLLGQPMTSWLSVHIPTALLVAHLLRFHAGHRRADVQRAPAEVKSSWRFCTLMALLRGTATHRSRTSLFASWAWSGPRRGRPYFRVVRLSTASASSPHRPTAATRAAPGPSGEAR